VRARLRQVMCLEGSAGSQDLQECLNVKNRVELSDLIAMSDRQRASIPADQLWELQKDLADKKAELESYSDAFYRCLSSRYADTFEGEREKDTGIIHIVDGGFKVSQEIKKNVKYDQKKLKAVLDRLAKEGRDISEYVEVTYKIPERKWTVWPSSTREPFEASRSIHSPRPSYSIEVSA